MTYIEEYYRLTLTWDVFKYNKGLKIKANLIGLTLTWDVFKFSLDVTGIVTSLCLTLTWDVFKCF